MILKTLHFKYTCPLHSDYHHFVSKRIAFIHYFQICTFLILIFPGPIVGQVTVQIAVH